MHFVLQNSDYESGQRFSSGTYNIQYTATDAGDNRGFCMFILTVHRK